MKNANKWYCLLQKRLMVESIYNQNSFCLRSMSMWMSIWIIGCNPSSKDELSNVFTFECRWQSALGVISFAMHWKHVLRYKWNQQSLVIFDYLPCFSSVVIWIFGWSNIFRFVEFHCEFVYIRRKGDSSREKRINQFWMFWILNEVLQVEHFTVNE